MAERAALRKLKDSLPLAGLLAAVAGLALLAGASDLGMLAEHKTLDWRFRNFSESSRRDPRIVLVMLDQASLDHFEKDGVYWPWPRSLYAAALDFFKAAGVKTVVFDVLFTSPSPYGQAEDEALGKAAAGLPVIFAMELGSEAHPLRSAAPPGRFALSLPKESSRTPAKKSARLPVPELLKAAASLGDAAVPPDADGIFRRMPLVSKMDGQLFPTLGLAAAAAYSGKSLEEMGVPLTDGRLHVRFHGKSLTSDPKLKTYDAYPLGDVVLAWQSLEEKKRPALDPAAFKDKLVFVGMSAPGLLDNRPSPVSPVFPGTEIWAAAADNMLNQDYLVPAGREWTLLLVLFAVASAGAALRLLRRAEASLAAALALSGAMAGTALLAFQRGVWLDMASPQLALWLGFAAASAYGYAVEGRQKRYIRSAFGFYLSPHIVEQIAESPEKLALGGERREVSFYFSDIAGFTTFSETLGPERLTQLMNRYLGEMTDTILASGGTLDKYIGDAIMAFWGAPVPRTDHALVACKAALANQKRLAELRKEFDRQGYPPVFNRIGLNSGTASIGNFGSPKRFSYTAIGDNVNLASRLEGSNKAYGTYILISESTRAGAGQAIEVRELDFVKVKGKNNPIRVYELLGLKGETDSELLKKARLFEQGLALYRARRWDDGREAFQAVLKGFGADHASEAYMERCLRLKETAPAPDWDGSHALTEK